MMTMKLRILKCQSPKYPLSMGETDNANWDIVQWESLSRCPFQQSSSSPCRLPIRQGGTTNTCYNCVDRHVEQGRGDQLALIYDSAMIGETRTFTYNDLLEKTATMAGALAEQGVQKGDVVLVYMPMIPEVS